MRTFGLFMILWVSCVLMSFNIWRGATADELLKMIFATQFAYILYRLIKEETKD
jgi:hypothetical protein